MQRAAGGGAPSPTASKMAGAPAEPGGNVCPRFKQSACAGPRAEKSELCRHGALKSKGQCPYGGPASSCGKALCRRHGLRVIKGICKGCTGASKKPAWRLVSPG